MNDTEMLQKVKISLGITGTFQDALLSEYITEVKNFLADAGVHTSVLSTTAASGAIARGVADLWNYGNSDTKLSEYFLQRAKQLTLLEVAEDEDL